MLLRSPTARTVEPQAGEFGSREEVYNVDLGLAVRGGACATMKPTL
jgi:hypothetical protein